MNTIMEIKIDLVIRSDKELYENSCYQNIFIGYENNHKKYGTFKNTLSDRTWYICGSDVYEAYTIDNVKSFKKIEIDSCISDCGLNQVLITEDKILILERNWRKCPDNMKLFKNTDIRII